MSNKKDKKLKILGEEVNEEQLKTVLKDIIKARGWSGNLKLEGKGGESNIYKYAFFDCVG